MSLNLVIIAENETTCVAPGSSFDWNIGQLRDKK
jgi:hypothetical protein